jgi:hypothetical protein
MRTVAGPTPQPEPGICRCKSEAAPTVSRGSRATTSMLSMPPTERLTRPGIHARLGCLLAVALACTLASASPALADVSSPPAETPPSQEQPQGTAGNPPTEQSRESIRGLSRERRSGRRARCHVEMSTDTLQVAAGEGVTVTGYVECPTEEEAAEETVMIEGHTAGTSGYRVLGTTTPEADGSYKLSSEPLESNTVLFAVVQNSRSRRTKVKVTARVTISGPSPGIALARRSSRARSAVSGTNAVTFTGTVSPHDGGARVVLERESATAAEQWRRIGVGAVGEDGTYSISHGFVVPGDVNLRVIIRARGRNLPGISETLSYVIAQRQNLKLTIDASGNPLSFGQSVTITGSGAPDESLTLMGRTNVGGFGAIAQSTADGEGHYSFPAQSPGQSMRYYVRAAHTRSVTLFEGVAPQLTAQASATSVLAGQPLTFSGTVAPDHSGDLIYLERENPSGVGFSIVQIAQIGPESTYSIEHPISGIGRQVYRVKVPADGESLAASSDLLPIIASEAPAPEPAAPVTPAPGAADAAR